MKLSELNSLVYIEQEITEYKEKILELREMAESLTTTYSSMPKGGTNGKKLENAVVAIVSYQTMLDKAVCEKIEQSEKIHSYILGIEDAQTRQIMYLRFVQGKTWGEIARKIGGNNSPSAVRMRAIRYIEGTEADE